ICARSIGDTEHNSQGSVFTSSMVFSGTLAIILTVAIVCFSKSWAALAGAKGVLLGLTSDYIIGYGLGIIPATMVTSLYPIMQLEGDKNRMMLSFTAMSIVDIILDIVNGYVVHGGILGMGLATSISAVAAMVILLGHFIGKETIFRFRLSTFRMSYIPEIISLGYMYIIKQLLITLLTYVYNNYLQARYGADMVAAYTAIVSAGSLYLCVGMAMGNTVSVLTGVYAGEEDKTSIQRMMRVAAGDSLLVNGILTVVAIFMAAPLVSAYFSESGALLKAAILGFRIYITLMAFRSLNLCIRGFYQSMKMQKLTFVFSVFQTFLCPLIMLFVLDNLFGIKGVWMSFVAGEVLAFVLLCIFSTVASKSKEGLVDKLLFLPKEFGGDVSCMIERTLISMEQVMDFVHTIPDFCIENGSSKDKANEVALAIEELAGNIIRYGFVDGKHHGIEAKVMKKNEDWILRLRDDCVHFNPVKYVEEQDADVEHVGIRMIVKRAKDIQYTNTLNMNNLLIRI
ncbi:MAG: hypothetical protein E7277_07250, partial [Lachnospiraceae bacterium]|nr:hypothetical protein [Lachnospiraceae bacterium]